MQNCVTAIPIIMISRRCDFDSLTPKSYVTFYKSQKLSINHNANDIVNISPALLLLTQRRILTDSVAFYYQ